MASLSKKAWIAKWCSIGTHGAAQLRRISPRGDIVAILNSRKDFSSIIEYAKDIYALYMFSLSEKLQFAHYTKGNKRLRDFFSPMVRTHFHESWYRGIEKDIEGRDAKTVLDILENIEKKHPQRWVAVGHNPYLEIREVFNLKEAKNKNGEAVLIWEEILNGGEKKNVIYKIRN